MKPAAHAVSVSAAVIAKCQPRGGSLQAAWKTTTTKETFGHDRNSILDWFIFLPLFSLPLIPNSALPFRGVIFATSSPCPLKFCPQHVASLARSIKSLLSLHSSPYIRSFVLHFYLPPLCFTFSPSPPISCCMPAKLPLPTTYLYPDSAANN